MAKCTRCKMELIGSARFCASCGAPVPDAERNDPGPSTIAGTPADGAAHATSMEPHISIQVQDPSLPVNPFASTASPNSSVNPYATTKKPSIEARPSEPPPVAPATPVSPLATSASLPDRGAFDEIMAAQAAEPAPAAQAATPNTAQRPSGKKPPGTQMMTNAPARPGTPAPAPAAAATPAKKPVARTVAMGNWNQPKPGSVPPPHAQVQPAPSAPRMPASVAAPSAVASSGLGSGGQASSGHGSAPGVPSAQPSYPHPQAAPSGPGGWGWNAPVQPPRPLVPGAHVNVTWSNGQRYPATVSQINGSRCLVVFPDGQQHWVEAQFVATV